MKHKVTIGRDSSLYGLEKDMYEAGEIVEFRIMIASDTNYTVTSDQAELIPGDVERGMWHWSFTMPDCDVTVKISSENTMTALPPQKKHRFFGKKTETVKTCPECGAEVEEGQKYCHECGRKLI